MCQSGFWSLPSKGIRTPDLNLITVSNTGPMYLRVRGTDLEFYMRNNYVLALTMADVLTFFITGKLNIQ